MNKLPPEQLLEKFENQTLEKSLWTHEAHLTIAFMYLKKYTPEETIILLRCGIISYNNAVGTINSLNRGYHETMTMFWIWVVASYIHQYPENKIEDFISSQFASKDLPFQYYSYERMFSVEARAKWITPDIRNMSTLE